MWALLSLVGSRCRTYNSHDIIYTTSTRHHAVLAWFGLISCGTCRYRAHLAPPPLTASCGVVRSLSPPPPAKGFFGHFPCSSMGITLWHVYKKRSLFLPSPGPYFPARPPVVPLSPGNKSAATSDTPRPRFKPFLSLPLHTLGPLSLPVLHSTSAARGPSRYRYEMGGFKFTPQLAFVSSAAPFKLNA